MTWELLNTSLYSPRTWTGEYLEIWYQDNDGTYYINTNTLVNVFIIFVFIIFFVFSFFSLSIKTFNKWRK